MVSTNSIEFKTITFKLPKHHPKQHSSSEPSSTGRKHSSSLQRQHYRRLLWQLSWPLRLQVRNCLVLWTGQEKKLYTQAPVGEVRANAAAAKKSIPCLPSGIDVCMQAFVHISVVLSSFRMATSVQIFRADLPSCMLDP